MNNERLAKAFRITVWENEGGDKYTDDPADRGGPTKYGITLRTLASWRNPRNVTALDVMNLTADEATEIYKARYWSVVGADRVANETVALALFDMAVNAGPNTATIYAQRAINACLEAGGTSVRVAEDGRMGPASISWLCQIPPQTFLMKFRDLLLDRIATIIKEHPENEKFRDGWTARIERLPTIC